MENSKKIKIALAFVLLLTILGANGAAIARTPNQPWRVTIHNVDLTLTDSTFSPQNFTAKLGDEITLLITNRDMVNMDDHTVRLRAPNGTTLTIAPAFDPGETVSITFTADQTGAYRFSCSIGCVLMGRMVGTYAGRITVTP